MKYGLFILLCLCSVQHVKAHKAIDTTKLQSWQPGSFYFDVHVSLFTNIFLQTNDTNQPRNCGLRPALGLSYCYKRNSFLSVVAGIARASNIPLAMDRLHDTIEARRTVNMVHTSITNNHVWKILSLGYGLGFTHHVYRQKLWNTIDGTKVEMATPYTTTGITVPISASFNIFRSMNVALIHQPQVYSFQHGFQYEHLWSVVFLLHIKDAFKEDQ